MRKFLACLTLLTLTSCVQFSIKRNYNEFRKIEECYMHNNYIDAKYKKGSARLFFNFNSKKQNSYELYGLVVENFTGVYFKDDSHLILTLFSANRAPLEIKLIAYKANNSANKTLTSTSGYYVKGIYYPGSIYSEIDYHSTAEFHISKDQIIDIVKSENIKFKLESFSGRTLLGEFSLDNINNLKEYNSSCILDSVKNDNKKLAD